MNMIEEAIRFAAEAHKGAVRKGKTRPYILHPIEAMAVVAGMSEDEEVIAAAVLHDVVEDAGVSPEELERRFSRRVRELVMAESEDKRRDLPAEASWTMRKQATIDHLEGLDRDAQLICLGDKLSNLREMSRDYALLGDALWARFNQKDKVMHAWYYGAICDRLEERFGGTQAIREYRELMQAVFGDRR